MSGAPDRLERERRWRLALGADEESGGLSERDLRIDTALTALYGSGDEGGKKRGGLGGSSPRVARWLGDIREFFSDAGGAGHPEGRVRAARPQAHAAGA